MKSNAAGSRSLIRVLSDSSSANPEVFRQQRVENTESYLELKIGQEKFQLVNWSRTGIAFRIGSGGATFPVGLKVGPTRINVGNIEVYNGDVEIKSIRKENDEYSIVGAEFKGRLFLVEGIDTAAAVHKFSINLESLAHEVDSVDPRVCKIILNFGSSLRSIKEFCDEQERKLEKLIFDARAETVSVLLPNLTAAVTKIFTQFNKSLGELLDVDSVPEGSIYHKLFEQHIYPYFQASDLGRRAVEKPRGYAGDFEMMNQIYRDDYEGQTLFGKILHHYIISEEVSEAVQFRKPYFVNQIEKVLDSAGSGRVLSVASGPAIEVQEIVDTWTDRQLSQITFVLFDLDRMALEHAQTKIFQKAYDQDKQPKVEFVNASVKQFLTHSESVHEAFDLIYSGGLFDYIDNLTAKSLVRRLFNFVKPGGRLIIGNFLKDNSSKAFCHLLTRWHLIHKTEDEMRAWAEGLSTSSVRIDYDHNEINAFIVITKSK